MQYASAADPDLDRVEVVAEGDMLTDQEVGPVHADARPGGVVGQRDVVQQYWVPYRLAADIEHAAVNRDVVEIEQPPDRGVAPVDEVRVGELDRPRDG